MATSNLGLTTLATTDQLSAFPTAFNADMAILDKAMTKANINPIPSTSDDTPSYWHSNVPNGGYCYFTQNRLVGQPTQYFLVLTLDSGGDMVQIGIGVGYYARTYRRSGTIADGWRTSWIALDNSGDLLWTNSDTTASFASQDVTVSLSNYSTIKIDFMLRTTYGRHFIAEYPASGSAMAFAVTDFPSKYILTRTIAASSTKVSFGGCAYTNFTESAQDDTYLIPYKIYGIV